MKPNQIPESDLNTYFGNYIKLSPNIDLLDALVHSQNEVINTLQTLDNEKANFRYEENKWSIKELMQHIIDNERIFVNRALRFARHDKTKLPSYEFEDYINPSEASKRDLNDLLDEYNAQRISTIFFFKGLSEQMLIQTGIAGEIGLSVLSIGFLLVGHDLHHLSVIKERYLKII